MQGLPRARAGGAVHSRDDVSLASGGRQNRGPREDGAANRVIMLAVLTGLLAETPVGAAQRPTAGGCRGQAPINRSAADLGELRGDGKAFPCAKRRIFWGQGLQKAWRDLDNLSCGLRRVGPQLGLHLNL